MREELEKKKEYLERYGNAKRAIRRIEESIEELRSMKMCPSVNMDGMPHASGVSDLSSYAAMVDEYEQKLLNTRYERMKVYQEIDDSIESLEDETQKDVLNARYIRLMNWEDICVKLGYGWTHIHRVHSNGLKEISI